MKFLKWLVGLLGVVGVAAGAFFFFRTWVDLGRLMSAVNVNHAGYESPWPVVWKAFVFMALGAFFLGLALGLPLWTRGGMRKQIVMESHGLDEDGRPLRAPEQDLRDVKVEQR